MKGLAHRWITRLSQFETLDAEERQLLDDVVADKRQYFTEDLQKDGEAITHIYAVIKGVVCQYKMLPDGRRQILGFLFAGDMCEPRQLLMSHADHSMCVFAPAEVALLNAPTLQRLRRHAGLARAIERYALMRQAIARERQLNVGFRTASERLAHLVCEIYLTLSLVDLATDFTFDLPFTQTDLADTLALSSVHVNRTLMEFRRMGILSFQNRQVVIHDFAALCEAGGFDPTYLRHAASPS